MTAKLHEREILHSIELLEAGKSLNQIGRIVGRHPDHLSKAIRKRGIQTDRRAGKPSHNRLPMNLNAIEEYRKGTSELSLSSKYQVSRTVITRWLKECEIPRRSAREANLIRFQNPQERKRVVRKAHQAVRDILRDPPKRKEHLLKISLGCAKRRKRVGQGEQELFEVLQKAGLHPDAQTPCGPYNIDLTVKTVAVELTATPLQGLHRRRLASRCKYLADRGFTVLYIIFYRVENLLLHADKIVRRIKRAQRFPASSGQYWVIRCGNEFSPRLRDQYGQWSGVLTPKDSSYTASKLYY